MQCRITTHRKKRHLVIARERVTEKLSPKWENLSCTACISSSTYR